ncbi:hypothetical protein B0I21_10486 [Sphingobacterium paludis]|uniref:Uncharacterized protein n=1 Tax=Sphingobacterium paludis TaxID=1476465 RepID=A0A4R7CZF8_9SPHI|nr:hypothetical protein B0I21_10486 [Sphingobacterium paludis]
MTDLNFYHKQSTMEPEENTNQSAKTALQYT